LGWYIKHLQEQEAKYMQKTDIIYAALLKMPKNLKKLQGDTGEWKITCTGKWILHLKMTKYKYGKNRSKELTDAGYRKCKKGIKFIGQVCLKIRNPFIFLKIITYRF